MEDADFAYALKLQQQFDAEEPVNIRADFIDCNSDNDSETSCVISEDLSHRFSEDKKDQKNPLSLVDKAWELIDPSPDVRALFVEYNRKYFWGALDGVEVRWSPRMTLCAGMCVYEGHGGLCSVRLSEPLLKLRPRSDLVETLLHEMIHAYLFVSDGDKDRDGHGPNFCKHMKRLNEITGANITIYHSFHDEVDNYRQHWWLCDGPCRSRPPYHGYVRRAMNRAPSDKDFWWSDHLRTCGGTYHKVKEPEGYGKKNGKKEKPNAQGSLTAGGKIKKPEESSLMKWIKPVVSEGKKDDVGHVGFDSSTPIRSSSSSNVQILKGGTIKMPDDPSLMEWIKNKTNSPDANKDNIGGLGISSSTPIRRVSDHTNVQTVKDDDGMDNESLSDLELVEALGDIEKSFDDHYHSGLLEPMKNLSASTSKSGSEFNGRDIQEPQRSAGNFLSKAMASAGKVLKELPSSVNVNSEQSKSSSVDEKERKRDTSENTKANTTKNTTVNTKAVVNTIANKNKVQKSSSFSGFTSPKSKSTISRILSDSKLPVGAIVSVKGFVSVSNPVHANKSGQKTKNFPRTTSSGSGKRSSPFNDDLNTYEFTVKRPKLDDSSRNTAAHHSNIPLTSRVSDQHGKIPQRYSTSTTSSTETGRSSISQDSQMAHAGASNDVIRIDEGAEEGAVGGVNLVICPVCCNQVPQQTINQHLDLCLTSK